MDNREYGLRLRSVALRLFRKSILARLRGDEEEGASYMDAYKTVVALVNAMIGPSPSNTTVDRAIVELMSTEEVSFERTTD